ncbi:alpha/beta hydrolase [Aurantibacillus circumpalustris]|uniref:alpha/beta hydrolase n=1 Tax=Aurantibacillus circumpalustris TaxID=3036359 RepID=UPI00295BA48C|nr:alpha/beta hydrolase [Aurantibacillus circumpalustris]
MWRLVIALLLFLISLLVFFKAPTNFLWKVSIVTIEFPYIPITITSLFIISCFYADYYKIVVIFISSISLVFYCLPIFEVHSRGKNLEEDLAKNFPFQKKNDFLKQPFSLLKLLTGIGFQKTEPQILVYKKTEDENLEIDFYPSLLEGKHPCIIVIHGGSWSSGDSKQLPDLNYYLSQKGYHVASINYRKAPEFKSPSQVEDTKDALAFLINNSEDLKIDTTNFVLLGRSAGAQIALVAAYTFNNQNIKGVVSFYGPADMVWGARFRSNKLVLNTEQIFRDYFGGLIDDVPQKYHEASAFEFAEENSPPTLLIHGPHDALVSYFHSVHLDKKLEEKKVPHYFLNLPWASHGCDYTINGPSGQITTFSIERFIYSVTRN